jgi:hypothetical protein
MAYYRDLTDYEYHSAFSRRGTKNVGWLAVGHEFETAEPTEELLSRLWTCCKISVAQTRGIHECEFCPGQSSYFAERNGERLLLGTAEIRVFSNSGEPYAAPTLIYHYVKVHKYGPPDEFIRALTGEPVPPSEEYFDRLAKLSLEWRNTSAPETNPVRLDLKSPGQI